MIFYSFLYKESYEPTSNRFENPIKIDPIENSNSLNNENIKNSLPVTNSVVNVGSLDGTDIERSTNDLEKTKDFHKQNRGKEFQEQPLVL